MKMFLKSLVILLLYLLPYSGSSNLNYHYYWMSKNRVYQAYNPWLDSYDSFSVDYIV